MPNRYVDDGISSDTDCEKIEIIQYLQECYIMTIYISSLHKYML